VFINAYLFYVSFILYIFFYGILESFRNGIFGGKPGEFPPHRNPYLDRTPNQHGYKKDPHGPESVRVLLDLAE
jgi:hypothetical protein